MNIIKGIYKRTRNRDYCVDIQQPRMFYSNDGEVWLSLLFTDEEIVDFNNEISKYIRSKRKLEKKSRENVQ